MTCDTVHEAISARIDGEDPGLHADAIEAHLRTCAACCGWEQRAHTLTRRARLGGSFLDHDLTSQILAALPAAPARRRQRPAQQAGLIAVALAQLAIAVPLLILGHDHDTGAHAAHELGSFDLALAIAFAVGAFRPALSAGLAWACGIAAVGLVGTAVADLIGGQTIGADEAQHLVAVAGAALLCWQARTADMGSAGPALSAGQAQAGTASGTARPVTVFSLEGLRESPDGGTDAARVTSPDTAAQAPAAHHFATAQPDDAGRGERGQRRDGTRRTTQPAQNSDGKEAVA
jgi:predicted anti-sigma-YlaC factor YlaD